MSLLEVLLVTKGLGVLITGITTLETLQQKGK
jgi:hypothetical protein